MITVKETRPTSRRNPGLIYAKALDRHNEIEQRLARVMNQWQKSRAVLKRLEKRLDEAAMDEAQAKAYDEAQAFIDDPL
jgi:Mg2+ and Co2+ transporter CorA